MFRWAMRSRHWMKYDKAIWLFCTECDVAGYLVICNAQQVEKMCAQYVTRIMLWQAGRVRVRHWESPGRILTRPVLETDETWGQKQQSYGADE